MFAISYLSFRAGHVYGRDAAVRLLANRPFRRVAEAAERVGAFALGMLAMQVTAANTPAVNGSALNPAP